MCFNGSGEHLFLCGSHWRSCETWHSQICEDSVGSKTRRHLTQRSLAVPFALKPASESVCLPCVCASGCVRRRVYKETRLCLALLYGLLSQYRLREAQELGDHMARLLLQRTGHLNTSTSLFFFFHLLFFSRWALISGPESEHLV